MAVTTRVARAGLWVVCAVLAWAPVVVQATVFPEGIDYVLQGVASYRSQSNLFRLPEGDARWSGANRAFYRGMSGAADIPLLSRRTRLSLSGTLADVRYDRDSALNHRPARLDAALHWQAGDLLAGTVSYNLDDRLYRYLDRTWPERDMTRTRGIRAEAGLRVTERWTLPVVSWSRGRVAYETDETRMLYNQESTAWSLAARYSGIDQSFITVGLRQARTGYPERIEEWAQIIDERYTDHEWFADWQWTYSAKTVVGGRLGLLRREYPHLRERSVSLPYVRLRAGWDYSAKTRFDLELWHQSYGNDDSPQILYATFTGGRFSIRWQHSPKLRASFNIVREDQRDTVATGESGGRYNMLRLGPRIEWDATPNVMLALDGWHDRRTGRGGSAGYRDNVVRFSITLRHDNGFPNVARGMWRAECDPPKYLESWFCD